MSDDELLRRVEDLESQVGLLREALESTLSWTVRHKSVAVLNNPAKDFYIGGQPETKAILDQG